MRYPYKETEEKWQKYWADNKVHKTNFEKTDNKLYTLVMFIYPSGSKLHCGHWYNYGPTDTWARYKKLKGFNVFEPMGYDAFGLPAENYAIQTGIHPQDSTLKNIKDIRNQLNKIGCMYDWDSELMTCDPKYYKWNQWLFLQLYKKGLAYRKKAPVNWCPKDQTVLANEQVQSDGTCERCGTAVIQKNLSQWFFKITDYAEELLDGLDKINWPDKTKLMQRNWIGKSVGAEVTFLIDGGDEEIKVFTTRPDTLFGATYMVLAPEHPLVDNLKKQKIILSKNELQSDRNLIISAIRKFVPDIDLKISKIQKGRFSKEYHQILKKEKALGLVDTLLVYYAYKYIPTTKKLLSIVFGYGLNIVERMIEVTAKHFNEQVQELRKNFKRDNLLGFELNSFKKLNYLNNLRRISEYKRRVKSLTEIERTSTVREKTGVPIGAYAINPVNGKNIPIWIADYVLLTYGTGAIMAVPAHDERDFEFARKYKLDITSVIEPDDKWLLENCKIEFTEDLENLFDGYFDAATFGNIVTEEIRKMIEEGSWTGDRVSSVAKAKFIFNDDIANIFKTAFTGSGKMINSGIFDGSDSNNGIKRIIEWLEEKGIGKAATNFRLRDWLISRQRYWGTPIPIIHCPACGEVPVDENELPVELPYDVDFSLGGESPLARNEKYINVKCPKCGTDAKRDPDTMDTFVDSSWYYLRYLDPDISTEMFNKNLANKWVPVDMYVGGAEHATMHLLYARFIHKFIRDLDLINSDEPFQNLIHQGTITNQGVKMSKSKDNVVNPDEFTVNYGSDVFRLYLMFMGPYEMGGDWTDKGISGTDRFVNKVYDLFKNHENILNDVSPKDKYDLSELSENEKFVYKKTNRALKRVDEELEHFRFNTAIAALMELLNNLKNLDKCSKEIQAYVLSRFAVMVAPLAPHLGEECWQLLGNTNSLFESPLWFEVDPAGLVEDSVNIAVQINGKLRSTIQMPIDSEQESVKEIVFKDKKVLKHIDGKNIVKEIYVKNKIYNIVAK